MRPAERLHLWTVLGSRDDHAAAADAEIERLVEVVPALEQDVAPRDAEIGSTEFDVRRYVVRFQQQEAGAAIGRLTHESAVFAVEHGGIEASSCE